MKISQKEISQIIELTEKIESDVNFQELLSFYPQGKKLTPFDFLSSLPDLVTIEYPDLYNNFKRLRSSFINFKKKKYEIETNLYSDSIFNPIEIVNISKEKTSTIQSTLDLVDGFLGRCSLVIPEFSLTIDSETKTPFTNGFSIFLKFENIEKTASYIIHEIGHLVELNDIHLHNECKNFIYKRQVFINEYVKKEYENGTEVFSIGLQMMFFSPIEFLFKDPFHFNLIYNYIRNSHGN